MNHSLLKKESKIYRQICPIPSIEGFYKALNTVSKLEMPIIATENGIADDKDDRRKLFINRYLYALFQAMQDGLVVNGYFYWSLMDNFEWAEGYSMKFGYMKLIFLAKIESLGMEVRHIKKSLIGQQLILEGIKFQLEIRFQI